MPDHFYVYPAYLGRGLSRKGGRRVPASASVPELTVDEIVTAAKHLGYKAEAEAEKQYPRRYFDYAGRVKVMKKGSTTKAGFLKALSAELLRQRSSVTSKP